MHEQLSFSDVFAIAVVLTFAYIGLLNVFNAFVLSAVTRFLDARARRRRLHLIIERSQRGDL